MDPSISVNQIMTTDILTVRPDQTMDKVQDIFERHAIHHIPVVEGGKVVGMISKADYFKVLHGFTLFKSDRSREYNRAILRSLLASEVMTKQVATLRPLDSVHLAAGFFRENRFHALPIVDEQEVLIGIITTYDLLNLAYEEPVISPE